MYMSNTLIQLLRNQLGYNDIPNNSATVITDEDVLLIKTFRL